jgi:hypothetical protein
MHGDSAPMPKRKAFAWRSAGERPSSYCARPREGLSAESNAPRALSEIGNIWTSGEAPSPYPLSRRSAQQTARIGEGRTGMPKRL